MAEETLQKGQVQHTPATIPPKKVEETAAEPEIDEFMMDENYETQEDILERQVALSIPIGRKIGEKQVVQKITIVEPVESQNPPPPKTKPEK